MSYKIFEVKISIQGGIKQIWFLDIPAEDPGVATNAAQGYIDRCKESDISMLQGDEFGPTIKVYGAKIVGEPVLRKESPVYDNVFPRRA